MTFLGVGARFLNSLPVIKPKAYLPRCVQYIAVGPWLIRAMAQLHTKRETFSKRPCILQILLFANH